MKRSYWVVANRYVLGARSRRFLLEVDGERVEVAAVKAYLIALRGDGWVTARALELAREEGVCLAFIGRKLSWAGPEGVRGVEYVLAQGSEWRRAEVSRALLATAAIEFGRLTGRGVEELASLEEEALLREVEGMRNELTHRVAEAFNVDASWAGEAANVVRKFLYAECLSAVLSAGLSPHIGVIGDRPLYEDLSLEFEPAVVWEPLLSLAKRVPAPLDLGDVQGVRLILASAKRRLEGAAWPGCRRSLNYVIRRRALALASSLASPIARYGVGWRG